MKIEERCGCGASIVVVDEWASSAQEAAGKWRAEHQHVVQAAQYARDQRLDLIGPAWAGRPYWSMIAPVTT